MSSRRLLQVASVLLSLVLTKAQDVSGRPGLSCVRWSPAGGQMRISFVRKDRTGARSLFLTQWSEDARLVTCEVHSDPLVTGSYANLCEENDTWSQDVFWKFNLSALQAPDGPCAPVPHRAPEGRDGAETEPKSRKKRAWTFPGTLWCGSGSEAGGYDQLGMFESADRCCREHDHCLHIIPAFTVNYGVFNPNVYTVSHCECDQRFRECLLGVNDSIASMVGYSFFNILQVPCFELKQQLRCTEMYWFGMCKVASVAPYAVFKSSLPYNTSDVTSNFPDVDNSNFTRSKEQPVTESPAITLQRKSSKTQVGCGSRGAHRVSTFHHRRAKGRGCNRRQKLPKAAPSQTPPASRIFTPTAMMRIDLLNASESSSSMPSKKRAGRRNKSVRKTPGTPSKKAPSTQPVTQLLKSHRLLTAAVVPLNESNNEKHEQETSSHKTTATRAKTKLANSHFKKKAETSKRHSLVILSVAGISATPITTKSTASRDKKGKQGKQLNSNPRLKSGDAARSTHAVRSLHQKNALRNKTDHKYGCERLKLLDECKFKILPWEKKYDLQNWESKTVYHCDCTDRLASEIERFEQPSIVPGLLVDFVSQQCFTLPKEKKCHHRKSCSGGFNEVSDLHQALKKIEEKDTPGVQNSSKARKRGIPVRLYKRCLRLRKEADLMAENR